ncbi:hypothetical protein T4B_11115 [Trichinella pseudospiralis]|uniref:Uncharacterized protein n=1 Tax=Trichinella pseudospiralis TaxID=6337 RepID=A0A0V1HKT5_TRIPS|nr:hypothetical protein T4B_4953 [Trichinella pseudospiralis]KRZ12407.1 hypothetical protein T4B_11115 [Trichinella pseudospiralis]
MTAANERLAHAWQLVKTCLEAQNMLSQASTVQHSVRIAQNLNKYVMHDATTVAYNGLCLHVVVYVVLVC